jgi:hypothetical protein
MKLSSFALAVAVILSPSIGFTQQNDIYTALVAAKADAPSGSAASSSITTRPTAPAAPAWESKLDRWLDLDTFNYASRYRSVFDTDNAHIFDQGQQRLIAHGEFKFDQDAKYGIGFHLSSGRYFNWAYADFIGGGQHQFVAKATAKMSPYQLYIFNISPTPDGFYRSGGGQLYLRQLFFDAKPIRGVELQFGGLAINHGVNTEATSYDDDGYMSGERLTLKRPDKLWLSEVSYTRGYLGDLYTPNFFARGERLSKSNYWQILGRKDFGKKIAVSADYTFTSPEGAAFSLKTTREAIFVDTRRSKAVDSVRFEAYQRINGGQYAPGFPFAPGKGYAVTANRNFKNRFALEGGIADIDPNYATNLGVNAQAIILGLTLNGDQYGIGKRYFVRPTIPLNRFVSLTGSYSHVFDTNLAASQIDIWNNQSLTAGLVFDLKKALLKSPVK